VTLTAVVLAVIGTLMAGLVVGIFIGRRVGTVTAPPSSDGAMVANWVQRIVVSSHNGVVLLNNSGDVVFANPPSVELGLVHRGRPDDRAAKAAERVRETGEVVQVDLSPLQRGVQSGRGPIAVLGEVRPLGDGFTVIEASDQSDAVRLEATRRDFVANVSHELKTPVGAMSLLAEAVLDAADDPCEVRRFGTRIFNEANRLGTLVTELIALSRLQGAERLPKLVTVEVDEVVHEALERCRLAAESANIRITLDPPSGLLLNGDGTLLVTALSNLLDNAVSYSPLGSPVSVSRRLENGFVEIAVTDRGLGIAPEHQERVFERFFRIDQARSRSTGGTGLGLAIVKHVAANHGGDVALWSKPATGSTFTLRIPTHPASRQPPPRTPSTPQYARVAMARVPILEEEEGLRRPAGLPAQGGRQPNPR
jgi:two-component system sensor histidine kinase SenX3